ncbi:hypothetical protein J3F83DRAFT_765615 [Trichoderma novae-zelandiae]
MTLTQYIFTALVFLWPRSRNDEPLAALPRPIGPWIWRRPVSLISLTILAVLTLRFINTKMPYFLPPKISDAAPRRSISTPQASSPASKKQQKQKEKQPQPQPQPLTRALTEGRRSASLGGWVKNMLPSQRPERGGTGRGQGYWEQMEKEGKTRPRRRVTDSQYSVGDVSVDSSHITRWNVPKDLSEDRPRVLPKTPPPEQKQQRRVASSALKSPSSPIGKLLPGSWNWSPQKGSEDEFSVTKLGGVLQRDNGGDESGGPSRGRMPAELSSLGTGASTAAAKGKQPLSHDVLRARVKARRRQRQSLKESGDYLGVQGVNPHTGEPDAMSPTDSSATSIISHQETVHSVMSTWRDIWKHNRHHRPRGSPGHDEPIGNSDINLSRSQKGKQRVRDLGKAVRWKRRVGEWSSLQEPDLSPIAQSLKSASPSSRRPSRAQRSPHTIQQTADVPTGEPVLGITPPRVDPLRKKASGNHGGLSPEASSISTARSSSTSTGLHGGRSGLDDSASQMSFLGLEAGRGMDTPCMETSTTTLSASQSIQSTPAFYRGSDLRPRLDLPGRMNKALSPHLCPMELGAPAPLIRLDESPLATTSQPEPAKTLKRLRRHRLQAEQSPSDGQATESRAVKGPNGLGTTSSDLLRIQTATGQPQGEAASPKRSACSRRLQRRVTKKDIKQGTQGLNEGPCHPPSQSRAEHQQTSSCQRKTPDQSNGTKRPAYTPTTITTGCSHQTSLFDSHQEALQDVCLSPTMARLDGSRYKAPAVRSLRHSLGNIHTNSHMRPEQSPISPAWGKSVGERTAGTTCLEQEAHKTQPAEDCLRNRHLIRLAMLAQDDSSLRRSTSTQDQTLLATTPCKRPLITSQEMHESMLERESSLADDPTQMLDRPGRRHRLCPENQDEDDTENPLPKDRNLEETDAADTRPGDEDDAEVVEQEKAAGLEGLVQCLRTLARLYWSAVWPILDPRTLRVEHEGPMPFWKACLLIVLATPAVAVGFVVAVEGVKFVLFLTWLMSYVDDGLAVWA